MTLGELLDMADARRELEGEAVAALIRNFGGVLAPDKIPSNWNPLRRAKAESEEMRKHKAMWRRLQFEAAVKGK